VGTTGPEFLLRSKALIFLKSFSVETMQTLGLFWYLRSCAGGAGDTFGRRKRRGEGGKIINMMLSENLSGRLK